MIYRTIYLALVSFAGSLALPVPQDSTSSPARIDLGITASFAKNGDVNSAILDQKANVINQGTAILNQKTNVLQQIPAGLSGLAVLIPERPKGREEAFFRKPTIWEPKDSIYDQAQKVAANIFHPKPIVDTISEDEKYGNTGDQFRSIGKAIVNGYEGFSNFLNTALDFPMNAMKQVTRKASSYLSSVGTKLVGL